MPVRTIGIIGAGSIVFKSHLPLLTALGFDVRWVLDSVRTRAKAVAEAFGVPMFLGADELATAPLTDLVLVACPYGSRFINPVAHTADKSIWLTNNHCRG